MLEIPERYKNVSITKDSEGWNKALHSCSLDFLKESYVYMIQGKAPFFAGPAGTGKTYAAAAIYNKLNEWASYSDLEEFKTSWVSVAESLDVLLARRDFRYSSYWEMSNKIKTDSLVVFDDFAHIREYDRLRELFWVLLSSRYDNKLPTIFTANIDMSEGWSALDDKFGEPFRRRIQEMSEGLVVIN